MSNKDTRIADLENEVEDLKNEVEDLKYELQLDINSIKSFLIPSSIAQEQLWSVVFEDILKQPVPIGERLDSMARKL